jgi:hypothetical protein
MEVAIKLLIGFAIFFTGVVFNVSIMKKVEGKPKGFLPLPPFIVICAGLLFLLIVVTTLDPLS